MWVPGTLILGQHSSVYSESGSTDFVEFSTFTIVEDNNYWFSVEKIRENAERHPTLLSLINNKDFLYRKVFCVLRDYLHNLKKSQQTVDDEWIEEFI